MTPNDGDEIRRRDAALAQRVSVARGLTLIAACVLAIACDDGGADATTDGEAPVADGSTGAGGAPGSGGLPGEVGPDAEAPPPLTLSAVSGDLTYAELKPDGHVYSVQADGALRMRVTSEPGYWSHHAVGPNPRYLVGVRAIDQDGDGRSDPGAPGEVWIIDVRERLEYPISPEGCDAGIGGVGWQTELAVLFAMDCGDGPPAAYLAQRDDRSRDRDRLLKVSNHDAPVRDVFPAVGTSIYAYVVDVEACAGNRCVVKPQIWVGDVETDLACQVTDGDLQFTDLTTITGGGRRLGDHTPSFTGDLTALLFSRNVGGKPPGPEGHHDAFRVGFQARALFAGANTCAVADSLTDLSGAAIDESYETVAGETVVGDERFPQGAAGRAAQGALLYTGQTHVGVGTSVVWLVDRLGTRRALTPERGQAGFARWIVADYMLGGDR